MKHPFLFAMAVALGAVVPAALPFLASAPALSSLALPLDDETWWLYWPRPTRFEDATWTADPVGYRRPASAALWPRDVPIPREQLEAMLRRHVQPFGREVEPRIPASTRERLAGALAYGVLLQAPPRTREDFVRVEAQEVIRVTPDGVITRGVALAEACVSRCERVTWLVDTPTEQGRMVSFHHGKVTAGVARISTVVQCRVLAIAGVTDCVMLNVD